MPIKSSEEAIGKYIGKYIGKHMESRQEADKGARLVRYSRGARVASTRFQFVSAGSQQWRSKLRAFAHLVSERTGCEPTMEGIRSVCGPRWAYSHREFIVSLPGVSPLVGDAPGFQRLTLARLKPWGAPTPPPRSLPLRATLPRWPKGSRLDPSMIIVTVTIN